MNKFLFLIILCCTHFCDAQGKFKYKNIDFERNYITYNEGGFVKISEIELTGNPEENATLINKYLKFHKVVKLPDTDIVIDKNGVTLNSNNILIFDKNTTLTIYKNNLETYQILRVHNVDNVEIYNPTIIGDRLNHIGEKGEWGHGISILGSKNVKIFNYKVEKCWGDGVYIGKSKDSGSSDKIYLYNGILDYNRRNGISITSAKNIIIDTLLSSNSYGTFPMYGLVIEPNNNEDFIENILINDITTYNNKEGGVNININKLGKGNNKKEVNISVTNFQDYYSGTGFLSSNVTVNPENFYGIIKLSNLKFYYNKTPFNFKSSKAKKLLIEVQNIDWKYQERKAFTKASALQNLKKRKDIKYKQ